jgi:hypothetical protein
VTKEAKEQLADLQSKLEMANIGKEKKSPSFSSVFLCKIYQKK